MFKVFIPLALCISFMPTQSSKSASIDLIVTVESGRLRGTTTKVTSVRAFKGIPFAEAPIGDLRWKPPRPPVAWTGVRDCSEFGAACPQPSVGFIPVPGPKSEDCLFLNIWTAAMRTDEKRPVMVWIHGGGSTIGSASQIFYDGSRFAQNGVVLVSINYRLGPFGFLSHPELSAESADRVSGNYGTLDQIAALKWVRHNITQFGGDPNNVTIFGESAGAVSCGVLLVSPLAKGLFHRAILESGTAIHLQTRLQGSDDSAEHMGEAVFEKLGVTHVDEARKKSADQVLSAVKAKVGLLDRGTRFGPVVDGYVIPDYPLRLLEMGKINNVPVIAGTNADEATLFSHRVPIRGDFGYRLIVRSVFRKNADAVLREFPPDFAKTPKKTFENVVTISSFVSPARTFVRAMSRHQPNTYLYHFTHAPAALRKSGKGATHGIEIPYVFLHDARFLGTGTDRSLAETMHHYWIQFAKTGDPNGDDRPHWPRYTSTQDTHLEFGDTVKPSSHLHSSACDLFEQIARQRIADQP